MSYYHVAIEATDEDLVHRTLAGDRTAALARALAILGDRAEADDVPQEAFVRAYEQLATCRTTGPARFMVDAHRSPAVVESTPHGSAATPHKAWSTP